MRASSYVYVACTSFFRVYACAYIYTHTHTQTQVARPKCRDERAHRRRRRHRHAPTFLFKPMRTEQRPSVTVQRSNSSATTNAHNTHTKTPPTLSATRIRKPGYTPRSQLVRVKCEHFRCVVQLLTIASTAVFYHQPLFQLVRVSEHE